MTHLMTKARQRWFFNDEEQRLYELGEMRLAVKFGAKKNYSDSEHEAVYEERVEAGLEDADLDTIEAFYKKLNAADEAEAPGRDLGG